ncbi:hypothetical protein COO60DRAFT_1629286 [Scenedesmus sp. NREL 46B-D3]|nr:hypothetical protein COO60DRAFT_1629286 [Scenedesmus sp. NREL 46B-D3]
MRLRSGRAVNDSGSHDGDMSVEQLTAEVEALKYEQARTQAELAALKLAQSESSSTSYSRGRPSVQVPAAVDNALEEQATASDMPENRRKSLAVVVTANMAVLDFLVERHDLLVAKGEFKHDPSLVQALEQGLSGVDGLPITSSRVMQLLEKQASARVVALTKQSAKASGGPSRSGGGSSNPPA